MQIYISGRVSAEGSYTVSLPRRLILDEHCTVSLVDYKLSRSNQGPINLLLSICEFSIVNGRELPILRRLDSGKGCFSQPLPVRTVTTDTGVINIVFDCEKKLEKHLDFYITLCLQRT